MPGLDGQSLLVIAGLVLVCWRGRGKGRVGDVEPVGGRSEVTLGRVTLRKLTLGTDLSRPQSQFLRGRLWSTPEASEDPGETDGCHAARSAVHPSKGGTQLVPLPCSVLWEADDSEQDDMLDGQREQEDNANEYPGDEDDEAAEDAQMFVLREHAVLGNLVLENDASRKAAEEAYGADCDHDHGDDDLCMAPEAMAASPTTVAMAMARVAAMVPLFGLRLLAW